MTADPELVHRGGDLKRELVDFAHDSRFRRRLRRVLEQQKVVTGDDGERANFLDYFLLQHRLDDGRTPVEHFVAAHPELPEAERTMLLGWRDVVEGIFEVQRQEGEALIGLNLVDELTYRIRSNMGPGVFARMRGGSFLIARLVPIADEWLLSGSSWILPAASRAEAIRIATDLAMRRPALVFRNPEKLEQAWELQREERGIFISFFGSDLVVLPGHELAERMRAYGHFRTYEVRDAEGRSAADRARQIYGVVPEVPDFGPPEELCSAETVGVIYDEVDGLNFLLDFGRVEEAFANPDRLSDPRHRHTVLAYLEEPSISPRLLRRLAERDPERASRVFQRVLRQPTLSWDQDGEALLRRYKASYFEQPVLPSVTPVSQALARAQLAERQAGSSWKAGEIRSPRQLKKRQTRRRSRRASEG